MNTLLNRIRIGVVMLAIVGIVTPRAAWAVSSKTGHVASHSPSPSRASNRVQVLPETKAPLTSVQRIVNAPKGNSPSGSRLFEIKDFSFGAQNPTTIGSATGGAGASKVKFNEFTIKKTTDSASPAFFKGCVAGSHYKQVTIEMRKAGGDPKSAGQPYLPFKNRAPSSPPSNVSRGASKEGPKESISIDYGKVEWQY